MKNTCTLIGVIAFLCLATNLNSQSLFKINKPTRASYKALPCERPYFQFVQICEGQKFRVVDSFYTKAGTYTNVTTTADGCDSTITTFMTLIPSPRVDTAVSVCLGKCFKVGTKCYSKTGSYADTLKTRFGCDSIIRLNLTILKPDSTQQNPIICAGQSITVGTHTYTVTGNYRDTVPNADGCFRLIKTNLTVRDKVTKAQSPTICKGGSVKVGSHIYDKTGVYLDTLKAITGCDSLITTNLTVLDTVKRTIDSTICFGKSVLFADTARTTTGMYQKIFMRANGCDSTVVLNLTVTPPPTTTTDSTICAGKSVTISGNTYTTTGLYTVDVTDVGGCKRIVKLNLTVIPAPSISKTITLCAGKDTVVDGRTYNQTTTFKETLKAVSGCDSLVKILNIIVLPPIQTIINRTLCKNQTTLSSGTYSVTLKAFNGCDSVIITNLKVNDTFYIRQNREICSGDSLRVGTKFYSLAGTYTDKLLSSAGCDSTVITTLTILPPPLSTTQSKTICKGDSVRVGNKSYKLAGTYTDKLTSAKGCDSLVTTTVKVNDLPLLSLPQGLKAKFCGDSLELNPKGDTASKYVWAWKTVPCASCTNPKIRPILTTTYYVTVTDKTTTCMTSDSVKVLIEGTYTEKIPNAFTPNGDNLNEVFNITPDDCVKSVIHLQIFSRWGTIIYDKTNLSPRNNEGWNGLSNNKPIGADVYVYIMEIAFTDGTTKKVTGEVYLVH